MDFRFAEKKLEYGGHESEALFDGIFAASQGRPSVGEVKGIADYIHDSIAIISTSKGIMTDKKARELHVGGEVLAFIW